MLRNRVVGGVGGMLTFLARCTSIDATQQGGGVVGGVGGMLTFLARCTNIDATQQGGGVVGRVGGMLTFLARCTNTAHVFIRYHWVFLLLQCHLRFLKKYVPSEITAKDPRTKKINHALWDWIYSWMWHRNCKGDAWGAMPKLFH